MSSLTIAPAPDPRISQEAASQAVFAFERAQDAAAVEALVDRAFGPGRFAKTAERIRECAPLRRDLSVCAWRGEGLVGVVRQWSVVVGDTPAVFLGPIAVDRSERSRGLGAGLIRRAIRAAEDAGDRLIILVGDLSFFQPLGFEPVEPGRVLLPGPVDPRRVLWRPMTGQTVEGVQGLLQPEPRR